MAPTRSRKRFETPSPDGLFWNHNPKYDRTTPKEAQQYLVSLWACIRSKLARMGIRVYGMRVCEPQLDETPHWHLMLFLPEAYAETVRAVIRDYALREDGDEPGAQEHRFQAVWIDWSWGTATGHIAKYISKNIDGFGLEEKDAFSVAQRVTDWAHTWCIRQFQQIGRPPVTVWRELRRI